VKKFVALALGLSFIATAALADQPNKPNKPNKLDKKLDKGVVVVVPSLTPETNVPPGLAKKDKMPPGLAKQNKTPPGWSKGNKQRGNENTVPTVGNLVDKALSN